MFFRGNFSAEAGILPSDDSIVSRFSSLSGCLNPKVKAFLPPVYSPFPGFFYSCALPGRGEPSQRSSRSRHSSTPCRVRLEKSRSEERRVGKEGRSRWSPYH